MTIRYVLKLHKGRPSPYKIVKEQHHDSGHITELEVVAYADTFDEAVNKTEEFNAASE